MQKYMVVGLSLLAATLSGCMPSATSSSASGSSTPSTSASGSSTPAATTPIVPSTPISASNPVSSTPSTPTLASGVNVTLQILALNDYHGNLLPSTYR